MTNHYPFELPALPYEYDDLEPYIDERTMKIHYTRHHQAYIDKLNLALEKYPELQTKNLEDLLKKLDAIPQDIRTIVQNHGGGHFNHSLFWPLLKKDTNLGGEIEKSIKEKFADFDQFKENFSQAAIGLFGSGWVWLVISRAKLEIVATPNQNTPLSEGKIPILGIDVWEHAYYLKYQNKRADYVKAFFEVINWEQVNENYLKAIKK